MGRAPAHLKASFAAAYLVAASTNKSRAGATAGRMQNEGLMRKKANVWAPELRQRHVLPRTFAYSHRTRCLRKDVQVKRARVSRDRDQMLELKFSFTLISALSSAHLPRWLPKSAQVICVSAANQPPTAASGSRGSVSARPTLLAPPWLVSVPFVIRRAPLGPLSTVFERF